MTEPVLTPDVLGELYLLLHLYIRINGTEQRDLRLLSELTQQYYQCCCPVNQENTVLQTLPAGSAAVTGKENNGTEKNVSQNGDSEKDLRGQILKLHQEGKSIRAIAAQVHKSATFVHRTIHEQL